jgi:phage replication-related protein YjqB (UPF0714/DUF867 family)
VHFISGIFSTALIGILSGTVILQIRSTEAKDVYASYTELAKTEREGIDYHVDALDRKSTVLVLAIHGGFIEPGSDLVADAIAGPDLSEYAFRVTKNEGYAGLHVTSTHFDDPRALALAAKSRVCISVHGYKDRTKEGICMGGGNAALRSRTQAALEKAFPTIDFHVECTEIGGNDDANIVNRCQEKGVQLELSKMLRDRLVADPEALGVFAAAVRNAVLKSPKR